MSVSPAPGILRNAFAGTSGVRVAVQVAFDQDRVLTSGEVVQRVGSVAENVSFYPLDGTDADSGYPTPIALHEGVSVGVEATLLPDCAQPPTTVPRFLIRSQMLGGGQAEDTAAATDPTSWREAVGEWCGRLMRQP
jgi:hypothetical protein